MRCYCRRQAKVCRVKSWEDVMSDLCFSARVRALLAAALLVAVGCFAGVAQAASIKAPANITTAGKIVYCSDISGPPLGFFDENGKPTGSDIDLGTEIAKRLGVKPEWANTPFAGIIPALQAKNCDAILSQLFDKPARREVIDFVDYMYSSQAPLVAKGNPKNIKSLDDLSGIKIAA